MSRPPRAGFAARFRSLVSGRRGNVVIRSAGYASIFLGFLLALQGPVIEGLWLVVIGWLLTRAARSASNTGRLTSLLDGLVARDALDADPTGLSESLTLETLVTADEQQRGGSGVYVVRRDGELLGVVDVLDADRVPRDAWATTHLSDLIRPLGELEVVPPDRALLEVVARFERTRREAFPVVDPADGRFLGFVTRERVHALMRSRLAQHERERDRARATGR